MADRDYMVTSRGMEGLLFDIRAFPEVGAEWNRKTVKDAAEQAARSMRREIPKKPRVKGVPGLSVQSHHPGRQLQDRIRPRVGEEANPVYKPGGAGGGGVHEYKMGVPLEQGKDDPATFYFRGTGMFGPRHAMIVTPNNMITFQPGAGWHGAGLIHVFRRSVGQRPHPGPLRAANRGANNVVRGRIQALRAKGFGV